MTSPLARLSQHSLAQRCSSNSRQIRGHIGAAHAPQRARYATAARPKQHNVRPLTSSLELLSPTHQVSRWRCSCTAAGDAEHAQINPTDDGNPASFSSGAATLDADSSSQPDESSDSTAQPSGNTEDSTVASVQLPMPRRSMQVTFTCNLCGERTERMCNPLAWNKGLVMAKCGGCDTWHKLRDEANLIDEIRYIDE